MGWQEQVVSTAKQLPPRILVYGPAGIGKTSFAASLPKPILLDYDHGADEVTVDRIAGPPTWGAALDTLRLIVASPGEYRTVAIDTLDALEALAIDHVLVANKIKSLNLLKWGEGHAQVASMWRELLVELDRARERGLYVCLLGHTSVRTAMDPQLGEFDQYTSQLGKKCWAQTKMWADVVGFANFDAALADAGERSARIIVTGERKLFTTRGSGFEAKNRFGIDAPLPLAWGALAAAIERHRGVADVVEAEIRELAKGSPELSERAEQFLAVAQRDVGQLLEIRAALIEKVNAGKVGSP
jgi:hypothetical protein